MNPPFSPKAFLKERRPEIYSDSELIGVPALDRLLLEYHLDSLTSRSEEIRFENFARELAKKELCPNILPHTGPSGGGDSKVDAETYPVADSLSLVWQVGLGREAASERWAFAFSAKKKWRDKVQGDIAKIAATKRGYTTAFFVTNQFVKDKARADLEDALRSAHGMDVRIFDRSWILDTVFTNHHETLAIDQLGIAVTNNSVTQKGPLDTEREQSQQQLEQQIKEASERGRFTLHFVDQCLQVAKLARNMERPRTEVEGLLARAERVARQHGTPHQLLVATYEKALTAFWYFEDIPTFLEIYAVVEQLARGTENIAELDLLGTLWGLLHALTRHDQVTAEEISFDEKTRTLNRELERLSGADTRPSTALQARTSLLLNRLVVGPPTEHGRLLAELRNVIVESDGLAGYPLQTNVRAIQVLGAAVGNCPEYAQLVDTVADLVARHEGDIAAARLLAYRGGQALQANQNYGAIRALGRAMNRLHQHESREDLIRVLYLCGLAFEQVGLLWAARGVTLTGAALATDEFYSRSMVTALQLRGYSRLKWLELQLGRVPHLLAWHQVHTTMQSATGNSDGEDARERINFDAITSILLLRASLEQLRHLGRLPDVLDDLGLPLASVALLFALGHEDELPDALLQGEEATTFFERLVNQPVAKQIASRLELHAEHTALLTSHIAGCRTVVETSTALPCPEVAESCLAAFESFASTAVAAGAITREPELMIHVRLDETATELVSITWSEQAGRPHCEISCALFNPHAMNSDDQQAARSKIAEFLLQAFARIFVVENLEETCATLLRDEQAVDRAVNFSCSFVVQGNILGDDPPTTITHWTTRGEHEYALTREHEWRPTHAPAKSDPDRKPVFGTGEPPPELLDRERLKHTNMRTTSLIRLPLWDRARWTATAFVTSPNPVDPPILAPVFENQQAAAEIFADLQRELGAVDEAERLRISILRGVTNANPHAYRVIIGTNLSPDELSPDSILFMVARMNTMDAASNTNLDRFLEAYKRVGGYFFMPAVMIDGRPALQDNARIAKRELNVREAWQISRHDPDAVGIHADDDPIIPADTEAPVRETLEARRRQRK